MFWIHTFLFTAMVFVPTYITDGVFSLSLLQTQEYVILMLGGLAHMLFYFQNKTLRKAMLEKTAFEQKASRTSRDLVNSYSYIGEINRKVDILKQMVFDGPLAIKRGKGNKEEMYQSIIEAIHAFTKSSSVAIRIVDAQGTVLWEIKNENVVSFYIPKEGYKGKFGSYIENEEVIIVCSRLNEEGLAACVVVPKQGGKIRKGEDIEILKALASHALLLHMAFKRNGN